MGQGDNGDRDSRESRDGHLGTKQLEETGALGESGTGKEIGEIIGWGDFPSWVRPYILALQEIPNNSRARAIAGVSIGTVNLYTKTNKVFRVIQEQAREDALDKLEEHAWGRATGTMGLPSDAVLMFLLRHYRPGTFGDKVTVESRGGGGEELTETERANRIAEIIGRGLKRMAEGGEGNGETVEGEYREEVPGEETGG